MGVQLVTYITLFYSRDLLSLKLGSIREDDRYIYDIKVLNTNEIRYCNALFMDRIDTYLGFSSLNHALGGIIMYKKLNDPPCVPRVNYTNLYKIIDERYMGSINI
mgnify:CR=1 FL=1